MLLVQEFVNDNSISAIALAFFTALLGAVSAVWVAIVNARHKTEELKNVTVKAAESAEAAHESAEAAQANTNKVSDGFVDRMDQKLDRVITQQDELQNAIQQHLVWHLDKET